jgi:hypothetical protein
MLTLLLMVAASLGLSVAVAARVMKARNRRVNRLVEALKAGKLEAIEVIAITDDRERVSLGTSTEPADWVSATPRLETDEVMLEEVVSADRPRPRQFRLAPGRVLDVLGIPGAIRHPLDFITTADGVERRCSFELDGHTPFWILSKVDSAGSAYRQVDVQSLLPMDDEHEEAAFIVAASRLQLLELPFGRGQAALVTMAIFSMFAALSTTMLARGSIGLLLNVIIALLLVSLLASPPSQHGRRHSPLRRRLPKPAPSIAAATTPPRGDSLRIDAERIDAERIDAERIDAERIDAELIDTAPSSSALAEDEAGAHDEAEAAEDRTDPSPPRAPR